MINPHYLPRPSFSEDSSAVPEVDHFIDQVLHRELVN